MSVERYYPRRSCRSTQQRMSGPSWSPAAAGPVSAAPSSTNRSARGGSSITPPTSPDRSATVWSSSCRPPTSSSEGGVAGGATRSESVRAGLAAVPAEATIICVHDAARPFASQDLFAAVIDAVRDGADAAVPGIAVTDTIKRIDADNVVVDTPAAVDAWWRCRRRRRSGRRCCALLIAAVARRPTMRRSSSRAAAGSSWLPASATNRKITHPDDLAWARELAEKEGR